MRSKNDASSTIVRYEELVLPWALKLRRHVDKFLLKRLRTRITPTVSILGNGYSMTAEMPDQEEIVHRVRGVVDAILMVHARRMMREAYDAMRMAQEAVNTLALDDPGQEIADWGGLIRVRGEAYDALRMAQEAQEAMNALTLDDPDQVGLLNPLGFHQGDRNSCTADMVDPEELIRMAREAIDDLALDDSDQVELLDDVGIYLDNRYSRTKKIADLDGAIRVGREAADATPSDHPGRAMRLINLGCHLSNRYSQTGAITDLEEAIRVGREAIDATPINHPGRATLLNNLGINLGDRYSRSGAMTDLEEAIRVGREAADATPSDHPDRAMWLNNLGCHLGYRFLRIGAMADLEEAIGVAQEAVNATPLQHPTRVEHLNNLGLHLSDRYLRTGSIGDLEEAIKTGREAVDATPIDHPCRAELLNNLGRYLGDRYLRNGAMADLEEAIRAGREAINATPIHHVNRARRLHNLQLCLGDRFSRTGTMADLEEAIKIGREAVNSIPLDHSDRATFLSSLGNRLGDRFSRTGAITDLEEAIGVGREAIDATPIDHPDRAKFLTSLGNRLGDRFSRTGAMTDLEEAIRLTQEAVNATPSDHPGRAMRLINLGIHLSNRYALTGAITDFNEAKQCFVTALHHSAAPVSMRVAAGRHFLSSPAILQDQQAYTIAKTTIDLIPLLTPRSLQTSDKTHLLSVAVGLSSDAAAIALHDNRGPATAIELLETGRGVIAGALFEQSDIAALERAHPDLARSFIDLRERLDAPPPVDFLGTAERPTAAVEAEGDRRRDAGPQLAAVLKAIRSKCGFERFLFAATEADMREAARPGPIVVLNVSSYRCDALLIEQSGIRLLELPRVSRSALIDHIQELESLETLGWLWNAIVYPVLNALGFMGPPANSSQWPHVWWVPTGILTRFPLHAAGYHLKRTGETTVDRVISSYASSVKAIIYSRRRPQQAPPAVGESRNAVVVAMQNTPKQEPLKHANDEVDAIVAVCESMGLPHDRPRPYKADVSSALEACRIFHFAGHGSTHPTEPLQSQLLLDDWDQEPFTVASLLETNLTLQPPFLAYLSACGTGQILAERSVDESIHLANACQLAGFRHVVGTLWSVDDGLCVDMARMTYEFLQDEGLRDECVSLGLHRAMRTIRNRWVDGEDGGRGKVLLPGARDGELKHGSESRRPLWVPYVHFGV